MVPAKPVRHGPIVSSGSPTRHPDVDDQGTGILGDRLVAMAQEMMMGDAEAAKLWLMAPHRLLGNETPLRHASTETGAREVEQIIGQLRHGVFS